MALIHIFPDNSKRADRIHELINDCSYLQQELSQLGEKTHLLWDQINETTKEMLKNVEMKEGDPRLKYEKSNVGPGIVVTGIEYLADLASGLYGYSVAQLALLNYMAKRMPSISLTKPVVMNAAGEVKQIIQGNEIVKVGRNEVIIQAEGGIQSISREILKFPRWMRIKAAAGGVVGGALLTFVIDETLDGIMGYFERNSYRQRISETIGPRRRLRLARMSNEAIISKLDAMLNTQKQMIKLGYHIEQLENLIKDNEKEIKQVREKQNEYCEEAIKALEELDKNRNSYIEEDAFDTSKCVDKCCWEQRK